MTNLVIDRVSISYPDKRGKFFTALNPVSLTLASGEFVSLIGHSGCGKSTLLNAVAGLLQPTSGTIAFGGEPITGPSPDRAVVFQSHALLPWLTCQQNVELGIRHVFREHTRTQIEELAFKALHLVHLEHAKDKFPYEISGGMKQRVGIARAIAVKPSILLLDEPFGALDALTKASLQDELLQIVSQTRCTVLMVTHDIDEAIYLSDRVVAITNGPGARIGKICSIELPRPRDRAMLTDDMGALRNRKELMEFLYNDQRPRTL